MEAAADYSQRELESSKINQDRRTVRVKGWCFLAENFLTNQRTF